MNVTDRTVKDFFNAEIRQGRRLLPDPSRVSGYGSLLKYSRVAQIMSSPEYQRVLDIGCNRGSLEYLYERNYSGVKSRPKPDKLIVGVDVAEVAVEQAHSLEWTHSTFLPYDGSVLPFCSSSFDLAIMVEVIEHVLDKKKMLSEVARILKPGGRLIVTTPNPVCWGLRVEMKMWWLLRELFNKPQPQKDVYIKLQQLNNLLEQTNFSVTNRDESYVWPHAFVHFQGWSLLPPLSPRLLLAYQKLCLSFLARKKLPLLLREGIMWTIWIEAELN